MAISRIQNVSANATNVAITSATANDIIVVWAYNSSAATAITLASGFTNIVNGTGTQQAAYLAYKVSVGGETTSGTWTNATQVVCLVFRGCNTTTPFGTTPTITAGNSASLTYGPTTLTVTGGTSVHIGFGGGKAMTAGMNGTPTGTAPNLTVRTNQTLCNGLDTAATATNLSTQTLTVTTSGRWQTVAIELKAQPTGPSTQQKAGFFAFF